MHRTMNLALNYNIYSMSQHSKQFVRAKPLGEPKQSKSQGNNYQRDTRQRRISRKYEQKLHQPKDPRQHIKLLINQYKFYEKSNVISNLCQKYPSLFRSVSHKPEPQNYGNLAEILTYGNKKQNASKATKQLSSDSSDPDWDSGSDKEIKLGSKQISLNIVQKVEELIKKQPPKRFDDLKRHEKQFLEDYYRQQRVQQLQAEHQKSIQQKQAQQKKAKEKAIQAEVSIKKEEVGNIESQVKKRLIQEEQWAEYNPNVGALISGGFLQKIQQDDEQFEMCEDFSVQSENEKKASSSSSSSDGSDDDMFVDDGPRTVTKKKQDIKQQPDEGKRKQFVNISNHLFTQISQQLRLLPQSCNWIISNKQMKFRVTTQYMDNYYQSVVKQLPYVSLNFSEFVHYNELQTEKGLQKLRKMNIRRKNNNNGSRIGNLTGSSNKNKPNVRTQTSHYKQKN